MKEENYTIDKNNPVESFNRIANELFNEYCISTHKGSYFITEIEFYFRSPKHDDKYVHGHESQKKNGFWYFHWAGIDVTIGDGENYGGILIRGIKKRNQNEIWEFTSGPINVMQELLSAQKSVFVEDSLRLHLIKQVENELAVIYCSPRIGLHSDEIPTIYHDKLYRYVIDADIKEHHFKQKGTLTILNNK